MRHVAVGNPDPQDLRRVRTGIREVLDDRRPKAAGKNVLLDRYVTHGKPALLHEEIGFTAERVAERVEGTLARSDTVRTERL